ncbi:hypothetical protein HYY69_03915 [Candidatus Woesearchaeota archaeon]|nr:hypothetical protein [Candidatus Woesearchaeota archaeon]
MLKKIFLFLIIILLGTPFVIAQKGHMKLLAVSEGGNMTGSIADLYLEIKEGSGRTYIDTYPLTKIDAQLSTRFAKDVACDFLEIDCSDKDFFYQINANSLIIGGPSAGASLTVLTISLLDNVPLNENIAMTGTINSGGVIGSVGGLKEKIQAASQYGISKVLIPKGKRNITEDNITVDLLEFGKEHGIEVAEVLTLEEAMYQFSGKKYSKPLQNITVEENYAATMRSLAEDLCRRTNELRSKLEEHTNLSNNNDALNLSDKSSDAFAKQNYYSAASFCFGVNIIFDKLILDQANISRKEQEEKISMLLSSINKSHELTEKIDLKTIQDLQTYIVVTERLDEAEEVLHFTNASFIENKTIDVNQQLAYATERLYSAYAWSTFFGKKGKEFKLNNDVTQASCSNKLAEVQVQQQYVQLLYPFDIGGIIKDITQATEEMQKGNSKRCFFKASKAKAEMNALLSSLGITAEQLQPLVQVKMDLFTIIINKQREKEIFPILGYSYYEYAKSLFDSDPGASLLYMEYALELSDISSYLEVNEKQKLILPEESPAKDKKPIIALIIGLIVGGLIGYFIRFNRNRKK